MKKRFLCFLFLLITLTTTCFADGGDSYNGANGQLTLPTITVGSTVYTNVIVTLGSIVSVGGTYAAPTGSSAITLAQLNACPNTSSSTVTQFWSCFSGTLVGVENGQDYPCTVTIGDGKIALSTTDQNKSIIQVIYSPSYSKSPSNLPNDFSYFSTDGSGSGTIGFGNSLKTGNLVMTVGSSAFVGPNYTNFTTINCTFPIS
ncbi:MAG: hypothetical protein ACXV74_00580 [Methylobacter sp.]